MLLAARFCWCSSLDCASLGVGELGSFCKGTTENMAHVYAKSTPLCYFLFTSILISWVLKNHLTYLNTFFGLSTKKGVYSRHRSCQCSEQSGSPGHPSTGRERLPPTSVAPFLLSSPLSCQCYHVRGQHEGFAQSLHLPQGLAHSRYFIIIYCL